MLKSEENIQLTKVIVLDKKCTLSELLILPFGVRYFTLRYMPYSGAIETKTFLTFFNHTIA